MKIIEALCIADQTTAGEEELDHKLTREALGVLAKAYREETTLRPSPRPAVVSPSDYLIDEPYQYSRGV